MRAIFMELAQKGIDREAIAEVLAKRGEDKGSEFGLAEKLVNKKLVHFQHLAKENFKKKIAGMLQRRGFSWETIYKVIDSLKEK
jgi:regulatory protein